MKVDHLQIVQAFFWTRAGLPEFPAGMVVRLHRC